MEECYRPKIGWRRGYANGKTRIRYPRPTESMKKYILFDHDGVLVDTEIWYFRAAERALADIGFSLDKPQYIRDMTLGLGSWVQPTAANIDDVSLSAVKVARDKYYQQYLRTEAIEI